jgi:hypothetical protein
LLDRYYGWSIIIEPESGDYFIDRNPKVALTLAKRKHPTATIMEMCLNNWKRRAIGANFILRSN